MMQWLGAALGIASILCAVAGMILLAFGGYYAALVGAVLGAGGLVVGAANKSRAGMILSGIGLALCVLLVVYYVRG